MWVDKAEVSTAQNCGNILAGVAPFAIERAWCAAAIAMTKVTHLHGQHRPDGGRHRADARRQAELSRATARIDGVPGTAAPIALSFSDTAGSTCGALLPTGRAVDVINGIDVTLIDNGMPVVVMRAADLGRTGYETRDAARRRHGAEGARRGDPARRSGR